MCTIKYKSCVDPDADTQISKGKGVSKFGLDEVVGRIASS